jgi:hypothetical protein
MVNTASYRSIEAVTAMAARLEAQPSAGDAEQR